MEKNYNYNFEQRAPQQQVEVTFSNIGVTECKKSVFNEKFGTITDGKLYHLTDTNEFFYDWDGKRYRLDLFTSASIEDARDAAEKATVAAEKAEKVANDAAEVAEEVRTLISGIKTVESVAEISNGYELTLSDGSKLILNNGEKGEKGDDGKSAYDIAVERGFNGTEDAWLASLKGENGEDGLSAYEIALAKGFEGDESAWLDSLKGVDGQDGADGLDGESVITNIYHSSEYFGTANLREPGLSASGSELVDAVLADINGGNMAVLKAGDFKFVVTGIVNDDAEPASGLRGFCCQSSMIDALDSVNTKTYTERIVVLYTTATDTTYVFYGTDLIDKGNFPTGVGAENETVAPEGEGDKVATIQSVMDYVNLMFEKKKIEETPIDYLYVNGYSENGNPSDIGIFNPYLVTVDDEDKFTLEFICGPENGGYKDGGYYAVLATIDIPNTYDLLSWEVYDEGTANYHTQPYVDNPRSATKRYGAIVYNSYVRDPEDTGVDDQYTEDVAVEPYKYRITIKRK